MNRRITDFPGFEVKIKRGRGFNPFDEFFEQPPNEIPKSPPNPPLTQAMPTLSKEIQNVIQDSSVIIQSLESITNEPASNIKPQDEPFITFTPVKEIKETQIVQKTFIQPRDSEGQRRLFKYPDMPVLEDKPNPFYIIVGTADKRATAHLLQFDGAANPNPGPASSGAVLWSPKDKDGFRRVIFESGKYLGKATNNIAEVQGLLLGLQIAAMRGVREILIEGDSELIIFQQIGKYKVSDRNLKVWWAQIQAAMMDEKCFDWIAIRQVPRELNERADSITKEVLSKRENFQRA